MNLSVFVILAACACTPAKAADWGQVKTGPLGNSVELTSPDGQVGLTWLPRIVPSEDLLVEKTTFSRYPQTYTVRYVFLGVIGNAIQIGVTGTVQSKDAKAPRSEVSLDRTIFLERADDGAFYLVSAGIKNVGHFRIARVLDAPAYYAVSLVQEK